LYYYIILYYIILYYYIILDCIIILYYIILYYIILYYIILYYIILYYINCLGNLSMQKQTICHCSQVYDNCATEIDSTPDIRHFFPQSCESNRIVPIDVWPASALTRDFLTREDLVRRDHDRDKRQST